jgi:hypothetical protein
MSGPMFMEALFTAARKWKNSSFHQPMNKESVVHTHYGILFMHKKNEVLTFETEMVSENIKLSEISLVQKERLLHGLTHM